MDNSKESFATHIAKSTPKIKLASGNLMPQVGFGTSGMSGDLVKEAITTAIVDYGYRQIDTAIMYKNQVDIGEALQAIYKSTNIKREDLYLISKVPPWMQGTEKANQAMEQILKELQTDYVDLVMVHWPFVEGVEKKEEAHEPIRLETWKVLEKYKEAGKIKDIASSNFTIRHFEHLHKNSKHRTVCTQMEIHPLWYDNELIEYCKKNQIAIQAYSSLGKGRTNLLEIDLIKDLAQKYKVTPSQICLKWAIKQGYFVIPKSKTAERIKANIDLFDFDISDDDMKLIHALKTENKVLPNPNEVHNSFLNLGQPQTSK